MPERSKIAGLPAEIKDELNRRLVDNSFSDYRGLSAWLAVKGFEISHAAVHRHGSQLENRIERVKFATEGAEALLAGLPDDSGAVDEANLRLAQESLFRLLMASEEGDAKAIIGACRAIAEMSRARTSIRIDRRKIAGEHADRAETVATKRGVSPETIAAIRAEIEGAE